MLQVRLQSLQSEFSSRLQAALTSSREASEHAAALEAQCASLRAVVADKDALLASATLQRDDLTRKVSGEAQRTQASSQATVKSRDSYHCCRATTLESTGIVVRDLRPCFVPMGSFTHLAVGGLV